MVSSDDEDDSGGDGMAIQPTNDVQFQGGTNPLLIQNILDKIFDSLPLSCLFKFRRVCKLWNNILVPKINENGNNTRLLKIVGGRGTLIGEDEEEIEVKKVKVIDIKEILVTMEAGRLKYSTCTKIYFNDSMELNPSAFEAFLALNGKNIKVLHYDGDEVSELKKILKTCTHNLEYLSLWKLSSSNRLYEEGESKLCFPKLENITFVSGEDGNRYIHMDFNPNHYITLCPGPGRSSPSENFLIDIFEASPKLVSLSCRLYYSRILEALTQTNSHSKLTSLCLKSRVAVPQLRSLISADMRLKILYLEGLCVTIYSDLNLQHNLYPNDPEQMEFAPLLLEFLQSQAITLEYLKLGLFTARNILTDVLFNQFPHMPNLITFVVGCFGFDADRIDFPFEMSTLAELFPKLKNLENIPFRGMYDVEDYDGDMEEIDAFEGLEDVDFPAEYPVSPNVSFSLTNIRGVEISPQLAQFFPCISELHLDGWTFGHITSIHKIPFYLPRLKHFYHVISFDGYGEDTVLKLIRILNGFYTGISTEECQRTEEAHHRHLEQVQLARSRPSIFDLNDLETLDFKFSCYESRNLFDSIAGIEVLISCGLSRMKHLKKLRFQFEQKVDSWNQLPDSRDKLLQSFGNRNNTETHSRGYENCGYPKEILRNWNFEVNLKHHTSEWDQFNFFREDPDIWNLGIDGHIDEASILKILASRYRK